MGFLDLSCLKLESQAKHPDILTTKIGGIADAVVIQIGSRKKRLRKVHLRTNAVGHVRSVTS